MHAQPPALDRAQRPQLARAEQGAVMLEFLLAFLPVLLLFLCILELTRFSIASLMLQRSAGIAARACAVIKNQPLHCDNNQNDRLGQDPHENQTVEAAAVAALKPLTADKLHVDSATCTIDDDPSPESGTDRVSVSARFRCVIPLAANILCPSSEKSGSALGAGARSRVLTASAKFAHQSARYDCWYSRELRFGIPDVHAWDALEGPEFF